MFEHVNHKAYGFEVAKNKTLLLSKAAYKGECSNLRVSNRTSYLALIPFYGGLPPGVTADLSVKSIGQGNSLVNRNNNCVAVKQVISVNSSFILIFNYVRLTGRCIDKGFTVPGNGLFMLEIFRQRCDRGCTG